MLSASTVTSMPACDELPRGEPASLQQRPRLVGEHGDATSTLGGDVDGGERRSDPRRGERAGVAVRQHARALGEERIRTHRCAGTSRDPPRGCASPRRASRRGSPRRRRRCAPRHPGHDRRPTPGSPPSDARSRCVAERARAREKLVARLRRVRASATTSPIAPATPIAGAPRTASVAIASHTSSTVAQLAPLEPARQQPLVDDVHRAAVRRPAHRFHNAHARNLPARDATLQRDTPRLRSTVSAGCARRPTPYAESAAANRPSCLLGRCRRRAPPPRRLRCAASGAPAATTPSAPRDRPTASRYIATKRGSRRTSPSRSSGASTCGGVGVASPWSTAPDRTRSARGGRAAPSRRRARAAAARAPCRRARARRCRAADSRDTPSATSRRGAPTACDGSTTPPHSGD